MQTYRAIMLTKRGGPEVLEPVELPLVEPGPGEVRVAVRATGAGGTDVTMRRGRYIFAPPMPFVPGYEAVGEVEAIGDGVTTLRKGDRVAALLVHGGYAEKIVRPADQWVPVPPEVDDADAVALILNYVTAYQAIHRVARIERGQTAWVNAANGGVGSALLDLLREAGVRAYGAAAAKHHRQIAARGAIAIEGRTEAPDRALRALRPEGVDVAFDGLGGAHVGAAIRATRRGGVVVGYGFAGATRDGRPSNAAALYGFGALFVGGALAGRRPRFYGITALYRRDPSAFREDLPKLFAMVARGAIKPTIAERLPLLAAREAAVRLERGGIDGKLVHLASVPA